MPQDALDAAAQAERLGLIGVLALLVIVLGWVLWKIVARAMSDRDKQLAEKDEMIASLLADNQRLRSLYDRVIVLAASASKAAAEEVKRLTDGRSQ